MKTTRKRMLAEIEQEVEYTRKLIGKNRLDPRVMQAMARVAREAFVPSDLQPYAYDNGPLPIGHGQTIAQPYIVALMTDLLQLEPEHSVLEVGTGSGYQAAILACLVPQVFTVERIEELLKQARRRFHKLGLHNIYTRYADGHLGWPSQAPFDGIIITAAASHVPAELIEQLRIGGVLVAPVERGGMQRLLAIRRIEDGVEEEDLGGVIFVPMLSGLT